MILMSMKDFDADELTALMQRNRGFDVGMLVTE